MAQVTQGPIPPKIDLRDMLRQYLIRRSLACMARAAARRRAALDSGELTAYCATIRQTVRSFYGELPAGRGSRPVQATEVSRFEKRGYRLENVLFESFPGWQVNATVYVPLDFQSPFPAVVIPVGHSGKQFESYQLPAQLFARCGYLAVLFDPPGQTGEKREGNDHFLDGVRCYLVGETSSRYFVADALRCIDYLETRSDVDLSRGVAMTGVSGGGTTAILATLLDDRIAVLGPSCCVSPLAELDITQCYAGCPETHMWRRYAEGIDEIDLLCAAFPTPILLMAGAEDEVFHIADTQQLAEEVAAFYAQADAGERFVFFVDQAGHGYTLAQARQFVRFMDRWLLGQPERALPDLPDDAFALDPYEEMRCFPSQAVNMRTLAFHRAAALEATRDRDPIRIRAAAAAINGVGHPIPRPQATEGQPFRVWTHHWQQVMLYPEEGIELPATFLYPYDASRPTPALLHLDDRGRNRLLYRHGLLARAIRFLEEGQDHYAALSVDLRGWGDSAPAIYPYEMASWGGLDRYLAYTSAALGDPVMAMRVRDALSALIYLRTRPEIRPDHIVLTGCGLGGVVALQAAVIDGEVSGIVIWDSLVSFRALLEEPEYSWPAEAFLPNALLHYDLPELATCLSSPAQLLNPRNGRGAVLSAEAVHELNAMIGCTLYVLAADEQTVTQEITQMLARQVTVNCLAGGARTEAKSESYSAQRELSR
ncbi:MAG: acetylxylan esterase [Anaerolineae bacterium]|nr:acetylxylan esterase [Anaerolineae bacterium]MDW8099775.1 acetylxylan esterase [Anaerolineae bacterium]